MFTNKQIKRLNRARDTLRLHNPQGGRGLMWLHSESITVDSDEGRFTLEIVDAESGNKLTIAIHDCVLDTFYDQVKGRIGPYLQEKEEAFAEFRGSRIKFLCNPDESAGMAEVYDRAQYDREVYDHERMTGAYALDDPKSEGFHDRMSAIWDDREKC